MGLQLVSNGHEKGQGGSYGLERGLPVVPSSFGKGLLGAVSASGQTSSAAFCVVVSS